jgi:DNA-binding PadR family transcriptional regulator
MSDTCHTCGQKIQQTHKEQLNKMKLTMLKEAANHVKATMKNDFKKSDLPTQNHSEYANFQKLRYHGLITPTRDKAGNRIRGRWLITRQGWAFLRGELDLAAHVLVKNNHIVGKSKRTLNVKDVYRGSEEVVTVFEYFDDDGRPVGIRPLPRGANPLQGKLAI